MGTVVGVVSLGVGVLLAVAALTGHGVGAWASPEALSPGLIGAAMVGVAPALLTLGRADDWEEARSLYLPLVVVMTGLLAVTLLNLGALRVATGGPLFLVLFSLGWVPVVALLALASVGCLAAQYRRPAGGVPARTGPVPMPGWSRPLLAVLGSGWLGVGAGLLFLPGFWSGFVPWAVNRADAQGLGVWALSLGVGVLGSLAEDDLTRSRPALRAVPAVAAACGIVLAVRATDVDWGSGGAVSLLALLGGLFTTGVTGRLLLRRSATAGNPVERPHPAA
ncbi:hypothetical protein HHL19_28610 [Streptomyces sp. R302]|uniref:hypothetical protein n=1 Tax=unclassified Streptomyces TaxID=2593676 RepID=UPI00145C8356|nr:MULTISPECIES: hypothetical protein [unclassified Streptomyces]NML54693.1 hypothetical protein [Streptomyces sp. R301]NML82510.1 hypothetical protein [Streptomyces sp. R302]